MSLIDRGTVLVTVMICCATAPLRAQSVPESKKILMVYAYDPNAPGVMAFAQQLKAVVSEQFHDRAEIYDEYLDANRFPIRDRSPEFARYFAAKYQGFRPDAIVAEGTPALRFATERLSSLFLGVPIVYGQAFEPGVDFSALPANVTGRRQPLPLGGGATGELRAILEDIAADDRRARDVIDHLRDLVKKNGTNMQVLSTNTVVSDVLALVRSDLQRRGVVVSTRFCEPAPLVLGDRVELQQVVLNLVLNACDAMSDTRPGERLLAVSTTVQGDARIEVRDRGSGIAPDGLAKIFEPFVTTKRDGLGLGLAICRSIVTARGGDISGINNAERGATFTVSLPLTGTSSQVHSQVATDRILR